MSKDEKQICLYCKWWKMSNRDTPEKFVLLANGKCCLRAPVLVQKGDLQDGLFSRTEWVETQGGDFCGEFKDAPSEAARGI